VRAASERLDVQRLRVLPVDPVADAPHPREVAQVLRCVGSAGHLPDRATSARSGTGYVSFPSGKETADRWLTLTDPS
jgi:hypothetical protein